MRYECDIPGFEECYFEVSERWTRGEIKQFYKANNDDYLAIICAKIEEIHLATVAGFIDSPADLTIEATDDIDVILWTWFSTAISTAVGDVQDLGNERARLWYQGRAKYMVVPANNQMQS